MIDLELRINGVPRHSVGRVGSAGRQHFISRVFDSSTEVEGEGELAAKFYGDLPSLRTFDIDKDTSGNYGYSAYVALPAMLTSIYERTPFHSWYTSHKAITLHDGIGNGRSCTNSKPMRYIMVADMDIRHIFMDSRPLQLHSAGPGIVAHIRLDETIRAKAGDVIEIYVTFSMRSKSIFTEEGITRAMSCLVRGDAIGRLYMGLIEDEEDLEVSQYDSLENHGWTEVTTYSGLRPAFNPSALVHGAGRTHAEGTCTFAMSDTKTIAGYFLTNLQTGSSGSSIILCQNLFSPRKFEDGVDVNITIRPEIFS